MDFTDPFVGIPRPKMTDEELAHAIRVDMAAELDAISLYQAHFDATDNPIAKRMIKHIMDEEKDHLEEFAQILYYLDPRQADAVGHARMEFAEKGGQPAEICTAPAEAQGGESGGASPSHLTVGSLKDA